MIGGITIDDPFAAITRPHRIRSLITAFGGEARAIAHLTLHLNLQPDQWPNLTDTLKLEYLELLTVEVGRRCELPPNELGLLRRITELNESGVKVTKHSLQNDDHVIGDVNRLVNSLVKRGLLIPGERGRSSAGYRVSEMGVEFNTHLTPD